jgi:exodeoxyribonuclease VII small subunit
MRESQVTAPALETLMELVRSGSFEDAMIGLEQVVSRLDEGQLSIGDAVKWYELGLALSQRCSALLEQAELQIRVLETQYDIDQIEELDDQEPVE